MKCGIVGLLGLPNAGKSSLMNALLGEKLAITAKKPQTTRRMLKGILNTKEYQIVFVDMPGFLVKDHKGGLFLDQANDIKIKDMDLILSVVDVSQLAKDKETSILSQLYKDVERRNAKIPCIAVINKIDLLQQKAQLLPLIEKVSKIRNFEALIPISAKVGSGLDLLLEAIKGIIPNKERLYDESDLTDSTERELVQDIVLEKTIRLMGKELPFNITTTVDQFEEDKKTKDGRKITHIFSTIHVNKTSQKQIVIGKGGQMIKNIGVAARRDIESLIGTQVMLKLHVKVELNWVKDPKKQQKLGIKIVRK